jgi:hypothetical protein
MESIALIFLSYISQHRTTSERLMGKQQSRRFTGTRPQATY